MQSWGKMQAEPEENVGRWRKMQGGGERCKELVGREMQSWQKCKEPGKKCREMGKEAGIWEKM